MSTLSAAAQLILERAQARAGREGLLKLDDLALFDGLDQIQVAEGLAELVIAGDVIPDVVQFYTLAEKHRPTCGYRPDLPRTP